MKRNSISPRPDWRAKVESHGLIWHSASDQPYWNEDSYYAFNMAEIEAIEKASKACYELLLEAGEYVLTTDQLDRFGIPHYVHSAIRDAWNNEPPALNYGRFDFGYDGVNPPKLFEFNCDTPTSLIEASVVQWFWKEEVLPHCDQFNSIHEALVAKWKDIKPHLNSNIVHFTHADDGAGEDAVTVSYMRDLAEEAGIQTEGIMINDIGWDGRGFVDNQNMYINVLQHLYPWEWLVNEDFGQNIIKTLDRVQWIEPIWKMMWSNKAILPILTEIAPHNHENLLPSYFDAPCFDMDRRGQRFVKKPILSREGANVEILETDGEVLVKSGGEYGQEGHIYQEFYQLPNFEDRYPVIGSWIVDGEPVGMGIREDGLITGNTARFMPHVIET